MSPSVEEIDQREEPALDETSAEFIDDLVKKLILFIQTFCDVEFFPYQTPIVYSIVESVILGDGDHKTLCCCRQSGKTQVMAAVIAGLMVILPRLAPVYPFWLSKFAKGFWCGVFAPTEEQADTVYGRIVGFLTSDHALEFFTDPDLADKVTSGGTRGKGKVISLRTSGSLCRMQTCNPKAKIEGRTYHMIFVDESQGADEKMILKSIIPMLAWNNGTLVMGGTAIREKCYFYKAIKNNERADVNKRSKRKSHHEYDWKEAAKYNKNYANFIEQQKLIIGEDSDEFRMSFNNEWILEKGMFVSEERLSRMYDVSQQRVHRYWETPVVVGIDVARSNDSTVVTVVFVDWNHPDGLGFYRHVVLDWLEMNDVDWESQYFKILDFLKNYDVWKVGVDSQGMGGPVAERLALLLARYFPSVEVVPVSSDSNAQHKRWTHLMQLIQRDQIAVPGHSKARATRSWKKFNQQMGDLEKVQRGPYMLAQAPDERGAFDDYPDSLAIACGLTIDDDESGTVTVTSNPFYSRT